MPRKLTNDEYLVALKKKKIKVIPLEIYISMHTKLSHKCTCGSTWSVRPHHVLRGVKCSVCGLSIQSKRFKHSHNKYLEELRERDMKTLPLETYKGRHVKILHKCGRCKSKVHIIPNSLILRGRDFCWNCKVQNQSKDQLLDQDVYEARLTKRKFPLKALEPYKGIFKHIDHYCANCELTYHIKAQKALHGCPRCKLIGSYSNVSRVSLKWLAQMHKKLRLQIQHAMNGGEHKLYYSHDRHIKLDGFNKRFKIAFEFLGEYWHGRRYKDSSKEHLTKYRNTASRIKDLVRNNYVVIYVWENNFKSGNLGTIVSSKKTSLVEDLASRANLEIKIL